MKELFELREKIDKEAWIIFPTHIDSSALRIRIEWYLDEKYGFEMSFSEAEINEANISLIDVFARKANSAITESRIKG